MTSETDTVLLSFVGTIARITLNRPQKRNALNNAMVARLGERLSEAARDEAIRAIVIAGAGDDFCSGADLSELQKISGASVSENQEDARSLMELFLRIRNTRVPVIAAVRGRALAGGCGLASVCDLVLAAESAHFGYPEVRIGFVPAMVMAILRRNVSEKRAFELITRGEQINAAEASRIGLVNQVFSDKSFQEGVDDYVNHFQTVSASAVALTKALLYQMDELAFAEALAAGVDINVIARMTDDCQKGIARFLDARDP